MSRKAQFMKSVISIHAEGNSLLYQTAHRHPEKSRRLLHMFLKQKQKMTTPTESIVIAIQSTYFPPLALSKSGNGLK